MDISTEQIDGFLEVIRKKSFSRASETLGMTQAALSIRIRKLEENLEKTLLIRNRTGVELTPAGRDFQEFAENFEILRKEYLGKRDDRKLIGELKIACFSTVGRSLVLPSLQKFLADNEGVALHFHIKEIRELYPMLHSGEADIILTDKPMNKEGLVEVLLGNEEYVFVSGKKKKNQHIFLNHDEDDLTSFKYFEHIGQKKSHLDRRYMDEIYAVLDGVAHDIGVSVLPLHLAREYKDILVPHPSKKLLSPVYLCYKKRAFYPPIMKEALQTLERGLKERLKK